MNRKFVGLDLSYTGTGVVILDSESDKTVGYEFKAGKAKEDFPTRLNNLWSQLDKVLPDPKECEVAIEGAAYGSEFKAFDLGKLNGVIEYLIASRGYSYTIVPPTVVKKYATGKGNAQKTYVAAHVASKWGYMHPSNNVTDAYVLARVVKDQFKGEATTVLEKGKRA